MNEKRVRKGEWNEALCFWVDEHPRTEIAAQACGEHPPQIWYISSKTFFVIDSSSTLQEAEEKARVLARDILYSENPHKVARMWLNKMYLY